MLQILTAGILKEGDTIGIMAPSSRVDREVLKKSVVALEKRGYRVYVHPKTHMKDKQSAGTGEQKVEAFHDLIRDPGIRAIFAAKGGNRAWTMLEGLDYRLIARNPKIIMGYSDVTALLNAIHKETGLVTFHGPMMQKFSSGLPAKQLAQCFNLLGGGRDMPPSAGKTLKTGKAEGRLIGGNLSLICSLMGTKWQPDFDGAILFLEDCGEERSRIDRMLGQLHNAGVFRSVAGVVSGGFTDLQDTGKTPFGFTFNRIVQDAVGDSRIPVVTNAPFGHGRDLYTFPVGARAILRASKDKAVLMLEEPAVSL